MIDLYHSAIIIGSQRYRSSVWAGQAMLDFALDDKQIERYRKIALIYLKNNYASVVVEEHDNKYKLHLLYKSGDKTSDDEEFDSIREIEEYRDDDFLPNLGARVQQQKIRMFQWLI